MKICPSCGKSNPDNSKKCFYCKFDLTDVAVYVPEPVESKPVEPEDFEDYEIIEKPVKEEKPKVSLKSKLKTIKFQKKPAEYFISIFAPIFSIIIFLITVFVTIIFILNFEGLPGIIFGLITFAIGIFISILTLWFSACVKFFLKKDKK